MKQFGIKNPHADLGTLGLYNATVLWNLAPATLIEKTIKFGQGKLSRTGALAVNTGEFTGRSPEDRFIVKDETTEHNVAWGKPNYPFDSEKFDQLFTKMVNYLDYRNEIYARDCYACANLDYRLNIRVITELPWQDLFAYNMFLRPSDEGVLRIEPDWHVIAAPGFRANPSIDGTRSPNFAIINFTKKIILIGGTAYTGEIKKGIFSVLNYILPLERKVLSMHCSANIGVAGDTALFFGLSGTGKTTLSTDPNRKLIGDDEHGWSTTSIFNFEGGCYAKCINLSAVREPDIYNAITFGAMLENVGFAKDGATVDYKDSSITENTRVSYPLHHIKNIVFHSRGEIPKNIFFLTCDAFGVLPPISRLTPEQAMYHFLSGYTAKVAGTEAGVKDPSSTFSACFGLPFLPLHPTVYAQMLGEKISKGAKSGDGKINVWLINTGWTGGPFGTGTRMELPHTRAMITAALNGDLDDVAYETDPIFGLSIPTSCSDVPTLLLNPRNTWKSQSDYDRYANELAKRFVNNFKNYSDKVAPAVLESAPKVSITAG